MDQFKNAFLARFFPITKMLNKNNKLNNFVAQPGESISTYSDRFTTFMWGVPNHRIDDE